jgi:hypothetical protein
MRLQLGPQIRAFPSIVKTSRLVKKPRNIQSTLHHPVLNKILLGPDFHRDWGDVGPPGNRPPGDPRGQSLDPGSSAMCQTQDTEGSGWPRSRLNTGLFVGC